jgi:hypothetical protein
MLIFHSSCSFSIWRLALPKLLTHCSSGLQNFAGLNVTQASISLTADANGDNFKGYVTVPNHSIVTLDIVRYSRLLLLNALP